MVVWCWSKSCYNVKKYNQKNKIPSETNKHSQTLHPSSGNSDSSSIFPFHPPQKKHKKTTHTLATIKYQQINATKPWSCHFCWLGWMENFVSMDFSVEVFLAKNTGWKNSPRGSCHSCPPAPKKKLVRNQQARWWLNQPIWKIWSSKWESSPNRGEKKNIWNHYLAGDSPMFWKGFLIVFWELFQVEKGVGFSQRSEWVERHFQDLRGPCPIPNNCLITSSFHVWDGWS